MALETLVYPQDQYGNYHTSKEFYNTSYSESNFHEYLSEYKQPLVGLVEQCSQNGNHWEMSSSSSELVSFIPVELAPVKERKKRRRSTSKTKDKEEVEKQRMTHIAVERNRRKQMNKYLAIMRSLMPESYAQRGDQASIIGGAINFVKELEHQIHTFEAHKATTTNPVHFSGLFNYPQYTTMLGSSTDQTRSGFADIQVTVIESHANIKILSKKRPAQLLKMVVGFQCLGLTVLHLNVTTVGQMVLYSLNAKIEEGSELTTVDCIAAATNHLLGQVEEEAEFN